jgi:hypothetical protein
VNEEDAMYRWAVVIGCVALTVAASAQQAGRGSLSGRVIVAWSGERPREAPIQIRHADSGAVLRTASDADGRYRFADIPAGAYLLTVAMPCCGFEPYRRDVTVRPGETTTLDISLIENVGGKTIGDDPGRNATLLRDRAVVPNLPVPRTADGKPDLSGVWVVFWDRRNGLSGRIMGNPLTRREGLHRSYRRTSTRLCLPRDAIS